MGARDARLYDAAEAERTGRLRERSPKASQERLAGCADREGGVQMASLYGGVRDVRDVCERKRRTQTERRGNGTQWQAGVRDGAQGGASVQAAHATGRSSVREGAQRRAVCP